MMNQCKRVVNESLEECQHSHVYDWGRIKSQIKDDLSDFLWKQTKRSPMILPIIMEAEI